MKNVLKSYFHYKKSERNGAFILLFLSFFGIIIPRFYNHFYPVDYEVRIEHNQAPTASEQAISFNQEPIPKLVAIEDKRVPEVTNDRQDLVEFDPNTADKELLAQLGFSPKLIQTLLNYRSKGGFFKEEEDLKKLYGLSTSLYKQLLPYVKIASRPKAHSNFSTPSFKIDINGAGELEWQKLYGIGKVFSKRIVKFRDKLGGFYDISQIAETYGLPDSTFQKIKPQLIVSTNFSSLHINQLTEDQLAAHPYINWKQAKTLINYRFHHGAYKNVEDIKASMAFKDSTLVKVKPYLSFQ